ncbi:UNVERIFIED_CONTAM: hypothetical protein Sindi_0930600 [Sesamum indicum]
MSSKSRSGSVHVSASESTTNSESSSSSGSSTTSPRETTGTSRDPTASISQPSDLPEEIDESDDTPVFQKYTEMMQQKSWLGIASIIKTTLVALKRKYYIPADYDIKIPRSFDRMHQPPEGYCAFFVLHLDVGLRFSLPREVNNILVQLGLCPMQLSPNSISHILMFIIVMKHLDLPPSFDNFWSLYNITASKRSGETGWFYLTARKDCRFLDDLRSNVGPWRDRYFFLRPPPGQSWDFNLGWSESKPKPVTFGEGFESDLINYITLFWYLPKVLLQEKVLKLAGLSLAPIPVKSSLESEIMLARLANKTRAKKGTVTPFVDQVEPTEPTESRSDPSSRSTKQGRLEAKLAADRVTEPENRKKFATFQAAWQRTRDERPSSAQRAKMYGEKWIPNWKISKNNSVLQTFAGQDSWEVDKAACLERDQVILAQTSLTSLEEHFAHNMTQAMAFAHHISLQGSMWRHDKILLEAKTVEMEKKILEEQELIESLRAESQEKRELASKLKISERELEETKLSALADRAAALEAGREQRSAEARLNGARDFLRSRTFREAVENQASDLMIEGFEKCQGQIQKLDGFAESFDLEQLDVSLDRNLEPYPPGPKPTDEFSEFLPLMNDLPPPFPIS